MSVEERMEREVSRGAAGQPIVVLVGHCGPDSFMLRSVIERAIGAGVSIEMADSREELDAVLASADLLLINRVLGQSLGGSGVELIRRLKSEMGEKSPRMMLVSNYADAQAEAEAVGALPGFGKAAAYAEETARRLRAAVGRDGAGAAC
jgi:two-component system chemotaxis response regulator CheY